MTDHQSALLQLGKSLEALPSGAKNAQRMLCSTFAKLLSSADETAALSAYRGAFRARDVDLLKAVFSRWPEANWTSISFNAGSAAKIGTLIEEGRIDMLRACHAAGLRFNEHHHHLVRVAIKKDNPALIRFWREDLGNTGLVYKKNRFSEHVEECGPLMAPILLEEMLNHLKEPNCAAIRSFTSFRLPYASLKPFAALLASGKDITRLYRNYLDRMHPHLADLIRKSSSNHGRLALVAMEPCPLSVIGRDRNATFFGMSAESFHQDFPEISES